MALDLEEPKIGKLHWPLILCTLAIAGLGVWNLGSAGRNDASPVWLAQLVWVLLGTGIVIVTLAVDYRVLRRLSWPVYVLSVALLIAVPFVGREIMGAKRWLRIGPLTMQPSEFAKIAVILMLSRYFADHPPETRVVPRGEGPFGTLWAPIERAWVTLRARYRHALAAPPKKMTARGTRRITGYRLVELWRPAILLFLPVVIVVKQPDLGTGLVTTAVGGSIVLFAGLTGRATFALTIGGLASAVGAWFFALKPYQKDRVLTFLDPAGDAQGKGYHAIQSLIAVGSGQMWGKGWGNGTQNQLAFLPEQHTDFAFPVWAEEHGFFGASLVVGLYLFLVLCALDIASNARDRFGAFLSFGSAALFFWHALINVGMVIGVLPVVGVPLLLMSYGGSSAVLTLLAIGVLLNVSLRRTQFHPY